MTVWVAGEHAHVQRLVSVVKTVTVLEECFTEEQSCVVFPFVDKSTQCKGIHKEMFPVYGGNFLSHKAVHNWVEKFSP
jgi:tRNA G26 N,N-dimethylase Trm1